MAKESQVIFDRNVIDFVTVAAEFCKLMEQAGAEEGKDRFTDTILKVLPLLYVKALLLPPCETMGDEPLEEGVREDDYEYVRQTAARLLGESDVYLDVFLEDMKYSDTPIAKHISEDLADIYQDIKNFIFVFRQGLNRNMHDALVLCRENFRLYWGQKLVNTLRALHELKFSAEAGTEEDDDVFYD